MNSEANPRFKVWGVGLEFRVKGLGRAFHTSTLPGAIALHVGRSAQSFSQANLADA